MPKTPKHTGTIFKYFLESIVSVLVMAQEKSRVTIALILILSSYAVYYFTNLTLKKRLFNIHE